MLFVAHLARNVVYLPFGFVFGENKQRGQNCFGHMFGAEVSFISANLDYNWDRLELILESILVHLGINFG